MSDPRRLPVILDTDIGDDVDDAYALALVASAPNADLLGVTTASGETPRRAALAAKFLQTMGRREVPVHAGRVTNGQIGRQAEWAAGFRARALKAEPAVEFLRRAIERRPGEVTLVAVGPLPNIADLIARYPETAKKLRRIVIMGGAVRHGYRIDSPPEPEWNIRSDVSAAQTVFSAGIPLVMAGLEATAMLQLDPERQKRLFAYGAPATDALAALTALWGNGVPTLYDPMAVAWALEARYCQSESRRVVVDESGLTKAADGAPTVELLTHPQKEAFLDWYVLSVGAWTRKP